MRASVILPTKDRGPAIDATLQSLLAQEYRCPRGLPQQPGPAGERAGGRPGGASDRNSDRDLHYEILIVDNASTPENAAGLRDWAARHPDRVRYIEAPIPGLNLARNVGIEHARGELLAFLDDDALVQPGWLEAFRSAFETDAKAWALGGRIVSGWPTPRPAWLDAERELFLSAFDRGDSVCELHFDDYPRGANMAFRREAFARCGTFAACLDRRGKLLLSYGDIEMCYRIEQAGQRVLYVPDAEVEHLIRGDRLSPEWFDRRYYWQGRSQAVFERLHRGRLHLLRKLPLRALKGWFGGERYRRHQQRGLASGTLRHLFGAAPAR
ncbi:MAG: glycosyltransferase family 2 protein [Planctomycetota bacterium]